MHYALSVCCAVSMCCALTLCCAVSVHCAVSMHCVMSELVYVSGDCCFRHRRVPASDGVLEWQRPVEDACGSGSGGGGGLVLSGSSSSVVTNAGKDGSAGPGAGSSDDDDAFSAFQQPAGASVRLPNPVRRKAGNF